MRRTGAISLLLLGAFALCSCAPSLESKKEPPLIYRLQPRDDRGGNCTEQGVTLTVPEPEVPAGFDTDQIVLYLENGRRLDYAAKARWPSDFDEMIQGFIVQSLNGNCSGITAQAPRFDMAAGYRLFAKVQDFEPVYRDGGQGTPDLRLAMSFILVSQPEDGIMDQFTITRNKRLQRNSLTTIAAGLEGLLQSALQEAQGRIAAALKAGKKT